MAPTDTALERSRENERKLMEEIAEVEMLEDTMAKSSELTAQMVDMLKSFDERLKGFEQSARPLHRSTQRLNQYYENIEKALNEANRIIEYFDLADKEKEVIAKGPDEADLRPYMESLGRITDALKFLTESRFTSGEKSIYKLRQQHNAGVMQLVSLFKKWLVGASTPVDTLDLIRGGHDKLPTAKPDYVRRINELATWLMSCALPPGASADAGPGASTGAGLAVLSSLGVGGSGGAGHGGGSAGPGTPTGASQAASLPDIGSDYVRVYAQVRGTYLVKSLQVLASQASDARRLEAKSSAGFISLTNWLARFLAAERVFAVSAFGAGGSGAKGLPTIAPPSNADAAELALAAVLDAALTAPIDLFLDTGNALLSQIKRSSGRADFGLVFMLFDVLEFWSTKRDELASLLEGVPRKSEAIEAHFDSWTQAALRIVPDFLEEVKSNRGPVPPDGTVHELTSNTISFMKKLLEYPDSTESILLTIGENEWANTIASSRKIKYVKASGAMTCKFFGQVLGLLDANLESKAKQYKRPALSVVFILNNVFYVLKQLKASGSKLRALLSETDVPRYEKSLRKHQDAFQELFKPLLEYLMDVTVIQGGTIKKDMSSNERATIKEKFTKFNSAIEDAFKSFRTCAVPDAELKVILIREAKLYITPLYERFLSKYQTSDFSKHKDKYIRYDVPAVEKLLDGLFLQ